MHKLHLHKLHLTLLRALALVAIGMTLLTPLWSHAAITWSAKAPLSTAQGNGPGSAVLGGYLYIVGGVGPSFSGATNKVQRYDATLNSWTVMAPLPAQVSALQAGVIGNYMYAIGGLTAAGVVVATNYRYDPVANTWSTMASMPTARYSLGVGVIGSYLYAVGGTNAGGTTYYNTVERYDPATNTWSTMTSMPAGRYGHSVAVIGNKIYVAGGSNPSGLEHATLFEYDPAVGSGGTWTTKASMPGTATYVQAGVLNGVMYVVGDASSTVYAYTASTNNWVTETSMLTARHAPGVGVIGNQLIVAGGSAGGGASLAEVESFTGAASGDPCRDVLLCNTSFEQFLNGAAPSSFAHIPQANIPCWKTTATDGTIEVWKASGMSIPPFAGAYFAELNSTSVGTLYQTFSVTGPITITVGFAHRGRYPGMDKMKVSLLKNDGVTIVPMVTLLEPTGEYLDNNSAWRYRTTLPYVIPASGVGTWTLRFESISSNGGAGPDDGGNFLDSITVTCATDARGPCLPPPAGLVGWWPLDETVTGIGSPIADLTGSANYTSGGPTNPGTVVGSYLTSTAGSKVGNSIHWSGGGGNFIKVTNTSGLDFPTSSFSIDAWINPDSGSSANRTIVSKRVVGATYAQGYTLYLDATNHLALQLGYGTQNQSFTMTSTVPNGAWSFVAASVNRTSTGGSITLYRDGTTQSFSLAGWATRSLSNTSDLKIGELPTSQYPSDPFWGSIDEVEIFNVAADSATMLSIYNAGSAGKCKTVEVTKCDSLIKGTLDSACCQYNFGVAHLAASPIAKIAYTITGGTLVTISSSPAYDPAFPQTFGSTSGTLHFNPDVSSNVQLSLQAQSTTSTGIIVVNLVVYMANGDSCRLATQYVCKRAPKICEGTLTVTPYVFGPVNTDYRTFTFTNGKMPPSPISSVDYTFVNEPVPHHIGGGLIVNGGARTWTFTNSGGPADSYTEVRLGCGTADRHGLAGTVTGAGNTIAVNLGVDNTTMPLYTGTVVVRVGFCDGDTCEYTYRWDSTITNVQSGTLQSLPAIRNPRLVHLGITPITGTASFSIELLDTNALILATTAASPNPEGNLYGFRSTSSGNTVIYDPLYGINQPGVKGSDITIAFSPDSAWDKPRLPIRIRYFDSNGRQIGSAEKDVTVSNTSDVDPPLIQRANSGMSLDVQPNPASSNATMTLSLKDQEQVTVWIADLAGNVVSHLLLETTLGAGSHPLIANLEGLANGTYFVIARTTDNRSATTQLKVIR